MGPAQRRLAVVVALVAFGALASPAAARLPAKIDLTVPPGGNAMATSPTLPADVKQGTITVKPDDGDADLFNRLTGILSGTPTKGLRALTCVLIAFQIVDREGEGSLPVSFDEDDSTLQLLFLNACLKLALSLPSTQAAPRAATAATGPCARMRTAVGMKVTRSGGRYRAHVEGTPHKPTGRSALIVSCRRVGNGMKVTMRPRSRRRTLRSVAGSKIGIALASPADATKSVRVHTTFNARK